MSSIRFEERYHVGRNDQYFFLVALWQGRWFGLVELIDGAGGTTSVLRDVSRGARLGLESKIEAIRMTAAVGQDPFSAFGCISVWYAPQEFRRHPEEYVCPDCWEFGCQRACNPEQGRPPICWGIPAKGGVHEVA